MLKILKSEARRPIKVSTTFKYSKCARIIVKENLERKGKNVANTHVEQLGFHRYRPPLRLSPPGLAWDIGISCTKIRDVRLERITPP